jgi:hypothetical protein
MPTELIKKSDYSTYSNYKLQSIEQNKILDLEKYFPSGSSKAKIMQLQRLEA